jgi:hypothetical protein
LSDFHRSRFYGSPLLVNEKSKKGENSDSYPRAPVGALRLVIVKKIAAL